MAESEQKAASYSCIGKYVDPLYIPEDLLNEGRVAISADEADHHNHKYTEFSGSVLIENNTSSLSSPRVFLEDISNQALMDGPIIMRDQGLLITGSKAVGNLDTGESTIEDASFLLHQSRFRGSAEAITRTGEKHLIISSGEFTRCEPDSNTWALRGGNITLKPETGFGTATNVTIRIKGVPVGYIPYIKFPIDDKRHTGILMPAISFDNEAATDFSLPIYLNISPSMDATYTPRSIWRRGISHQLQFRFITEQSSNEINGAWLKEDDLYDENILLDQRSAGSSLSDEHIKQDRWFFNFRHNRGATSRFKTTLRYSAVSDNEYLDDLGGNFGSSAVDQFQNPVDVALASRRVPNLERLGEMNYQGNHWNALIRAQGFQKLSLSGGKTYERLPQFQLNYANTSKVTDIRSRLDLTKFDKDNEFEKGLKKIIGNRYVLDLSIATPLRSNWGFFTPKVAVIHRSYKLEDVPVDGVPGEYHTDESELTTPKFSIDTGLYFDRSFGRKTDTDTNQFLQTLEPRLYFLYVKEEDQDLLPIFDTSPLTSSYHQMFRDNRFSGSDRIGDARQASLGITNRFIDSNSGSELVRFDIGQIYYFKDRKVLLPPQLPAVDPTASTSPLYSQLKLSWSPNWRLSASIQWEPRNGTTNKGGLSLKYLGDLNHILNLSYRYTNKDTEKLGNFDSVEESDINFIWPIKGGWSVIGKWNYGWDAKQTIESFFGLEYNDCCWKSRLVVRRFLKGPINVTLRVDDASEPDGFRDISTLDIQADTGIFFEFQLKGLATLGGRLNSLLDTAIPGYRKREEQISR